MWFHNTSATQMPSARSHSAMLIVPVLTTFTLFHRRKPAIPRSCSGLMTDQMGMGFIVGWSSLAADICKTRMTSSKERGGQLRIFWSPCCDPHPHPVVIGCCYYFVIAQCQLSDVILTWWKSIHRNAVSYRCSGAMMDFDMGSGQQDRIYLRTGLPSLRAFNVSPLWVSISIPHWDGISPMLAPINRQKNKPPKIGHHGLIG
jgi:hypothetical protein